jgi:hypothetical protein
MKKEQLAYLRGEVLDRRGLDGVDGELVVRVHGRETTRDCASILGQLLVAGHRRIEYNTPNHFFEPDDSMTSTTPARSASTVATWCARTPMSPVAAGRLTCVTSEELKMDWKSTWLHKRASRHQRRYERVKGSAWALQTHDVFDVPDAGGRKRA